MVVAAIIDVLSRAARRAQGRQKINVRGRGLRPLPQCVPRRCVKRRQQPGERVGLGRHERSAKRNVRRFGKGGKRREVAREDGFIRVFIGKDIAVLAAECAAVLVLAEGKFDVTAEREQRRAVRQTVEKVSVRIVQGKARRRAPFIRQLCRGGRKGGKQHHGERKRRRERKKQTVPHAAPQ